MTTRSKDEQEPSMEEILSSIRRIIADEASEEEGDDPAEPEGVAGDADRPSLDADDDVLELTEVVREDDENGGVIELDRAFAQPQSIEEHGLEAMPGEPAPDEPDRAPWDQADTGDEPESAHAGEIAARDSAEPHPDDHLAQPPMDIRDDEMEEHQTAAQKRNGAESLVSDRAAGAATGAFSKLSQAVQRTPPEVAVADDSGRTVEQFAEDMMRPMLRDWLEENLPALVERIVQKEIQKIVRRAEIE